MAYLCPAPTPRATTRLANAPRVSVGIVTTGGGGAVTLPSTGQQWPLPVK